MKLTRNQIEAWLRQAECTDWGADMSTDDQVDVLRVAIRAFDAEEEIARVTAERDDSRADIDQLRADLAEARAENARLREAMPSDDVMLDVRHALTVFEPEDEVSKWLARLDAARKGVL